MTLKDVKEANKYKLEVIDTNKDDFFILKTVLQNDIEKMGLFPFAIGTIISDYVYDKYEIEEEDCAPLLQDPSSKIT